jgi:hypothetical protein
MRGALCKPPPCGSATAAQALVLHALCLAGWTPPAPLLVVEPVRNELADDGATYLTQLLCELCHLLLENKGLSFKKCDHFDTVSLHLERSALGAPVYLTRSIFT